MSGYSGYANNNHFGYLNATDDADPYAIGYSNHTATNSRTEQTNRSGNGSEGATPNDTQFDYLGHSHNQMNSITGFYQDPVTGLVMAQDGNSSNTGGSGGAPQTDFNLQVANTSSGYTLQQPPHSHTHGHGVNMNPNIVNYSNNSNDYLSQMRQQQPQPQQQQPDSSSSPLYQHSQQYDHQHSFLQQHQQQESGGIGVNMNGINSIFPHSQDAQNGNDSQSQHDQSSQFTQHFDQLTAAIHHFGEHHEFEDDSIAQMQSGNNANINADPLLEIVGNGNGMNGNLNALEDLGAGMGITRNSEAEGSSLVSNNPSNRTSLHSSNSSSLTTNLKHLEPEVACIGTNVNGTRNNIHSMSPSLASFSISITSLSIEPLSAQDVVQKVQSRCREVISRYLPCVEFLVLCQQELRNGLEVATRRTGRGTGSYAMSASEFYNRFFAELPNRFFDRNKTIMPMKELTAAYKGVESLLNDVKKMELSGKHEGMKNAFLGGMRDGESWGLRKWLSKNGGALHICNDIELIWYGIRDKKDDSMVVELAKILRPIAKESFDRLKGEVPKAYQEVSTAHPYLPFFHRLESALKGLSEFDPEDDEVICLDDSDDDEDVKPAAVGSSSTVNGGDNSAHSTSLSDIFRHNNIDSDFEHGAAAGNLKTEPDLFNNQNGFDLIESGNKSSYWTCSLCTFHRNPDSNTKCDMCDIDRYSGNDSEKTSGESTINSLSGHLDMGNSQQLAELIDSIACALEEGREPRPLEYINHMDFWSNPASNYIFVLRLFRDMILSDAAQYLLDSAAFSRNVQNDLQRYYSLIRNPIFFRDIVVALAKNSSYETPGQLEPYSLRKWNMFEGKWLIQAVDLVLLNTLAFIGKGASPLRKQILAVRKAFWKKIKDAGRIGNTKHIPPRRTENSDFLLYRKK